MTFASPSNPSAQVTLLEESGTEAPNPKISIEVAAVDAIRAKALARGLPIAHGLSDEPWEVRRFYVVDPNGVVINLMGHLPDSA